MESRKKQLDSGKAAGNEDFAQGQQLEISDGLHRRVGSRQVQLFAIGGSIGTALFVSIGGALHKAGPVSLLLAFISYSSLIALVNNCIAEMTILMPVSGGFPRLAGYWVDDALGFMSGINFFLYEAIQLPFEITALNIVLSFWRDDIPVTAVCASCIVAYGLINIVAVKHYGEAEFWLSSGKVLLVIILFCFTFITMVGGNPQHDAYGFRYWRNPGPFAEWRGVGDVGRLEGFLAAFFFAALMIVGPEYISMIAGEAERPRTNLKTAFKTTYWRFGIFFIGGAFCVGLIVPSDNETLAALALGNAKGTAAASPYVVAMRNLGVEGLPHVINALLFTSIFSAGNTYVYVSSRNLYSLALSGHAPKILLKCTRNGVPIYCFAITMLFPFLSFLQVSSSSAQVLGWLINLITSGGLVNYIVICITYLRFYRASQIQGIDRKSFPYYGRFQPYSAWIALIGLSLIIICQGYDIFLPGAFTVDGLFTKYAMLFLAPVTFLLWKLCNRTRYVRSCDVDLVWERPLIDAYESDLGAVTRVSLWVEIVQTVTGKRQGRSEVG